MKCPKQEQPVRYGSKKSSNNIKNDLLLRKEDFLLKRQTKGIRLTEIFKNLAKNTLSEHTSGAEQSEGGRRATLLFFIIKSVPNQTGGYQTKQRRFSSLLQGDRNQVNPPLSVKRQRTQREREQELWNSRIKVPSKQFKGVVFVYLVIWSYHKVVLSSGKALHIERSLLFWLKILRNAFMF